MSAILRILRGLAAIAALADVWIAAGGRPAYNPPAPAADPETVRDVFLLLDRGPLHFRLKITIAGKSPHAVRRDYLARLFKALDTDGDGKLSRAEFERSPLNTTRRGPGGRPLTPKEAAETVPAARRSGRLPPALETDVASVGEKDKPLCNVRMPFTCHPPKIPLPMGLEMPKRRPLPKGRS